jgi:hypothetical protein
VSSWQTERFAPTKRFAPWRTSISCLMWFSRFETMLSRMLNKDQSSAFVRHDKGSDRQGRKGASLSLPTDRRSFARREKECNGL